MNANPAALTARADSRLSPPRRAFASFFFKRKSRSKKGRKRETNECQKDNMPLGENYYGMRWKSPGDCSKPTPHFTTTASEMLCLRLNSAFDAAYSPDHSTPIAVGSNENGKFARGKKESPFACLCLSKEPHKPVASKRKEQNQKHHKHATPSGFARIGLFLRRPKAKKPMFRRFPALTSTQHSGC